MTAFDDSEECPKCGSDYVVYLPDDLAARVNHNRECGDCAYEWTVPLD